MNELQVLSYEELELIDGGIDWNSIGMGTSMTAGGVLGAVAAKSIGQRVGGAIGTAVGGPVGTVAGTLIGGVAGGVVYSLFD